MERLILKCGRFITPATADVETRIRLIEHHLARLSEETEYIVGEMDRALDALEAAIRERDTLAASAGEEGGV